MCKKLIALLCCMSISLSVMPIKAADKSGDNFDKSEILSALGIGGDAVSGFVSNDWYIGALSGFRYESGYGPTPEKFARMTGIIDYGKVYDGKDNISVDDALKYAVITLGYKEYAENVESYPAVADSLGLDDGLDDAADALITAKDCRTILYNMLDAEPMSAILSGDKVSYIREENQTMLSKYRDIYRIYGRVTADEKTSLSEEKGCRDGFIRIDNTEYKYQTETETNFLGKNVEVYLKTDKTDDSSVLYITERKNKNNEITIEAEDIYDVASDYSAIYYNLDNKEKTVKLSGVPKVIYNGVFYADYQKSDFMPEVGNVRLVDYDLDEKYDVVFITSYETVIVKATDTSKKTIYSKVDISYALELEPDDSDVKYTISDGFTKMSFSDIKNYDVLSIAESKSAENKIIEILDSQEKVSGVFGGLNESELEIVIDGAVYDITPAFIRFKNNEVKTISMGTNYTFYTDIFGNVVGWAASPEDGYAVVYKFVGDEMTSEYSAVYMNLNGEWIEAPFADNVYLKDVRYRKEAAYEELKDIRGCVVKLKTNASGQIKKIETAVEGLKSEPNKFTKTPSSEYTWRSALKSFDCQYFLNKDAKVVVIPADVKDKEAYQVREPGDYFASDKKYTASFYDIDEYNFTGIVSLTYTPRVNNTLLIVKAVNTICLDDEILQEITGCTSDYQDITVIGKNDTIFNKVSAGDIVKISLNTIGRADDTETVYKLKNDFIPMTISTIYTTTANLAGTVEMIDAENERMKINCNGTKYNFRVDSAVKVVKYDTKFNDVETLNYNSIMPDDKVFIRLSWGKVQDVIIRE